MSVDNSRHRFLFGRGNIRGNTVHIENAYQALLQNADYPPLIQHVIGEACVAGLMLAATIKSEGSLTLQLQSGGGLSMLILQVDASGEFRGMARWQDNSDNLLAENLFGSQGKLVVTLDPGHGKKRYQGIVDIIGNSLCASIENYLARSEQLPTRVWIAVEAGFRSCGLFLQQLPDADPEYWQHLITLAETIKNEELLLLPAEEIIHRLYHQEELQLFEAEAVQFKCSCDVERVTNMILGLGIEEARSVVQEEGNFDVNCEYCLREYRFDAIDIETLFKGAVSGLEEDKIH